MALQIVGFGATAVFDFLILVRCDSGSGFDFLKKSFDFLKKSTVFLKKSCDFLKKSNISLRIPHSRLSGIIGSRLGTLVGFEILLEGFGR